MKKLLTAVQAVENRHIVLFLDYDGTLAPLKKHPALAVLPGATKKILRTILLKPRFSVAIVSGRRVSNLKKVIGLPGAIYAGNHGFEISGCGLKMKMKLEEKARTAMRAACRAVHTETSGLKGVFFEKKGFSIAVHYRLASAQTADKVLRAVGGIASDNGLKVKKGKKVLELVPPVKWDKGAAVLWILAELKKRGIINPAPIYLGDDLTDEDAFRILKKSGITALVGPERATLARYRLHTVARARLFLKKLSML